MFLKKYLALFHLLNDAYITHFFHGKNERPDEPLCLSMFIGSSTFMYSISLQSSNRVIELCHVELNNSFDVKQTLKDRVSFLIQNHLLHRQKFEKVFISILNSSFTLLPNAFASELDLKSLLNFSSGDILTKKPFQHHVKDIAFCFSVEQELSNYLEKTFTNANIRHAGAVNIQLLFSEHSLSNCNVFLNISDKQLEIAAKQKNDLLFYNVFDYESDEDVLYYLLFAMEQFNLNPLHVAISIAAQRAVDEALMLNIKKYVKQVNFVTSNPAVKLGDELSKIPNHFYFTLLNQHLCEL